MSFMNDTLYMHFDKLRYLAHTAQPLEMEL